ncbi:uncharacterized protein LOC110266867 [Arachis ipaensis]|uniref:uncharacterized protein LOC110266867 n=1 Tax=Arachis ipaensis TaxID=130454 RepID=UPI000A2B1F50|nr:uncharacterized protein LOC110266867 [Arachis ipaensis]
MSEPEGGEEEDRDESTSERTESESGLPPQRRCSRRHRRRGGASPEERERKPIRRRDGEKGQRHDARENEAVPRALSSLLGSIEAAAAARACRAPVLTFGFYDYFLRFIGAVFDGKVRMQFSPLKSSAAIYPDLFFRSYMINVNEEH